MASPYKILGIPPNSNPALVKSRYRELAKKFHPDISKEENAEERFIEITEAYELILEGPKRRTKPGVKKQDPMEARRERARRYAKMEYEQFQKNNAAFKKEWYYGPTKYFSYGLIGFGYLFSGFLTLLPLMVFILTGNWMISLMMIFGLFLGFYVFVQTTRFRKGIEPYFQNY